MKLEAKKREVQTPQEKTDILGIIYGSVKENIPVVCKVLDFEKVYEESGSSGIVELEVDGKSYDVIIKDVQLDHTRGDYYHADFYAVTQDQEIEANVSFEFEGEDLSGKAGGIMNTSLTEVEIKALPKNLPKHLVVDLSELTEVGDTIRLSDLTLPEGVRFSEDIDLETPIVSIITARSVEEAEEANAAAVEIEEEEGEEEEGAEGETEGEATPAPEGEGPAPEGEDKKDAQENS